MLIPHVLALLVSFGHSWRLYSGIIARPGNVTDRGDAMKSTMEHDARLDVLASLLWAYHPAPSLSKHTPNSPLLRHSQPLIWHRAHVSQLRNRNAVMKLKAKQPVAEFVSVDPDGEDMWRASDVIQTLRDGGVGVIPTDTGYSFVTLVSNKQGIDRILRIIGFADVKKPLSLLCRDLSMVAGYTHGIDKNTFKFFKKHLPGPYTFIMRAGGALPKMFFKEGKRKWKRNTVGIRIPDDVVAQYVLDEMEEPLICSTVPVDVSGSRLVCGAASATENWCKLVDFILDGGERSLADSTIYDFSEGYMELVREGAGALLDDIDT